MAYCVPLGIPHSRFLAWAEDDQDKALAYLRDRAHDCPGCGTRAEDWEADRFAYVGDAVRCPGCEALEQERRQVPEEALGVRVRLLPRQVAEAMMAEMEGDP